LKGIRHEPPIRPNFDRYRNRRVSEAIQVQSVRDGSETGNSPSANGAQRPISTERSDEMDRESS